MAEVMNFFTEQEKHPGGFDFSGKCLLSRHNRRYCYNRIFSFVVEKIPPFVKSWKGKKSNN